MALILPPLVHAIVGIPAPPFDRALDSHGRMDHLKESLTREW
jgi:hypothetical protein